MQLSRALELLVLGLSAMSVAEATFINPNGVAADGRAIQQRQDDESPNAATTTSTTSTAPPPKTTTTPTNPTTTSTSTRSSTSTPPATTTSSSSSKPPATTSSSSSEPPAESTSSSDTPSSTNPPSSASSTESEQPPATTTIIWTTTRDDGTTETMTSQSTLPTPTPGLADSNSGQASGMSPQTRNTVIGVVVGVGGAIILGGLALVAWRIWGRKKHQEENDGLMDYGSTVEKPDTGSSVTGRTPFQSTLESYHAPTQVNTAANF